VNACKEAADRCEESPRPYGCQFMLHLSEPAERCISHGAPYRHGRWWDICQKAKADCFFGFNPCRTFCECWRTADFTGTSACKWNSHVRRVCCVGHEPDNGRALSCHTAVLSGPAHHLSPSQAVQVSNPTTADRRHLLKRAVELLREAEWEACNDWGSYCVHCGGYERGDFMDPTGGHKNTCEYIALMKEAENEGC